MSVDVSTAGTSSVRSHFQLWEVKQLRRVLGRAFTRLERDPDSSVIVSGIIESQRQSRVGTLGLAP